MTAKQSPGAESRALESDGATHSLGDLDGLAEHVDGAFVLLVRITPSTRPAALKQPEPPRYRRRVYLSAAAAERAVRAAQDRGEAATVYLCELTPLHRVVGGDDR